MSNASDFIIENGVLKEYIGPGGDVVIPEGITEIGNSAFNPYMDMPVKWGIGRKNVRSVIVPAGTARIGNRAFANCVNLESVVIPPSVVSIGDSALHNTIWQQNQPDFAVADSFLLAYKGNETEIVLPNGIVGIADEVFKNREEIKSVCIPDEVEWIGSKAFYGCSSLENLALPGCLSRIGHDAFGGTPWLRNQSGKMVIVNNVLHFYRRADEIVDIPEGVTSIGSFAFAGNYKVRDIRLPGTLKRIEESAFERCSRLERMIIPEGVAELGDECFSGCSSLETLDLPKSLKKIGRAAFAHCTSLRSLPDMPNVDIMSDMAFFDCKKLRDEYGRIIVNGVLYGCSPLIKSLRIEDEVDRVSQYALDRCEDLEEITAPEDVFDQLWEQLESFGKMKVAVNCVKNGVRYKSSTAYIKKNKKKIFEEIIKNEDVELLTAFLSLFKKLDIKTIDEYIDASGSCPSLLAVLLNYKAANFSVEQLDRIDTAKVEVELGLRERTMKDWREIFKFSISNGCVCISGYKQNETTVEIPECIGTYPVKIIGRGAFSGNQTVNKIVLPAGITDIEPNAFKGCKALTNINMPEKIEKIGSGAFQDCTALTGLDLPASITSIGGEVFKGCISLRHIRVPDGIDIICVGMFDGCIALENVVLPNNVSIIADYAFRDCKVLASLNIPEGIQAIRQGVFTNCKSLSEIHLPNSMNVVWFYAFRNCTKLSKIVFHSDNCQIYHGAFGGCKKLTIHAPAGSYAETYAKENNVPFVAE